MCLRVLTLSQSEMKWLSKSELHPVTMFPLHLKQLVLCTTCSHQTSLNMVQERRECKRDFGHFNDTVNTSLPLKIEIPLINIHVLITTRA